jgi:hypothetical protein
LLILVLFISGLAVAQSDSPNVVIRRKAIMDFVFDPEAGRMDVGILNATGSEAYRLDSLEINAIGDQWERGRSVRASVERTSDSTFTVNLGLPEGEWNLHVKAEANGERLEGLYLLGVGTSPINGQLALAPPNPEVSRITWIIGLMLGIPVALGVLVTVLAVISKARQTARAEA